MVELGEQVSHSPSTRVAVIGAGFIGAQITAELLLVGADVSVYDPKLAQSGTGQVELDMQISSTFQRCEDAGLLRQAGVKAVPANRWGSGPWELFGGCCSVRAKCAKTLAEAVEGTDLVVEAVPDRLDLKASVFREALRSAREDALMTTNTLGLPLTEVHNAVIEGLGEGWRSRVERSVLGLRFLSPVVFIPFVEVTFTELQARSGSRDALLDLLLVLGKHSFVCSERDAVAKEDRDSKGPACTRRLGLQRFRLTETSSKHQQQRCARRRGDLLRGEDTQDCFKDDCRICLSTAASIPFLMCQHMLFCADCAEPGKQLAQCPKCRVQLLPGLPVSSRSS
eukprot:TRINITY_DN30513_c0_g1_i1.p1 TRINITY_DN30513_c0_g1~~TRINITY_DN30513_c0_g1_i1.p1  ORF type:complete len:339 (+),score=40.49 TRINITY_DN30513_c0_g1_i1:95-1111(+)